MNLSISPSTRQRNRPHWSMGTFCEQWMLALGTALEQSTAHTYTSAASSYITFCDLHHFPTEPTVERLCFYIVYMLHHIKPTSMKSYLSGICAELEPFYPDIHSIHSSKLINRTLARCTKLYGSPAKRKWALTKSDLLMIIQSTPHHATVTTGSPRDGKALRGRQTWAQPLGWPLSHRVCWVVSEMVRGYHS